MIPLQDNRRSAYSFGACRSCGQLDLEVEESFSPSPDALNNCFVAKCLACGAKAVGDSFDAAVTKLCGPALSPVPQCPDCGTRTRTLQCTDISGPPSFWMVQCPACGRHGEGRDLPEAVDQFRAKYSSRPPRPSSPLGSRPFRFVEESFVFNPYSIRLADDAQAQYEYLMLRTLKDRTPEEPAELRAETLQPFPRLVVDVAREGDEPGVAFQETGPVVDPEPEGK